MYLPLSRLIWSSRLFWKLFAANAGLVVGTAALAALVLSLRHGAQPIDAVREEVASVRSVIWSVALAVSLLSLVVTYLVVAYIARPLAALTEAAQAIASGTYGLKVHIRSYREIGLLVDAFNHMSVQLAEHVARIREDGERISTILGSMSEGLIAIDSSQRVLFANHAAHDLLGWDGSSVAGRPLWELVRNRVVHDAIDSVFSGQRPRTMEFELPGPRRRAITLRANPLRGEPCPGAVLVLLDVTELRRLENLRQEFVANVSHELKTPLTSIKAYAETLLGGALEDAAHNRQFVERIAEQASRLQKLIFDLLSLARIESGQQAFEIRSIPLAPLADASVAEFLAAAEAKGIALSVIAEDPLLEVRADEEGLREILHNLLDNAIKYSPPGGRVTVRWRREAEWGIIEVQDSGIGIAPEDQARIFERFYRVDRARSRELGGTGLGLSIVKHLTQAFGGTVAVRSELGQGSTFEVRLPVADGQPAESAGPESISMKLA